MPTAPLPHRLLFASLLVLLACSPPPPESTAESHTNQAPLNVLLVSLDTLRRDRVGAFHPGATTTPNLDAFAAKSLRFDQAFSHQAWTLSSHATMLSGLYPAVHEIDRDRALNPLVHTLPELFAESGRATIGVVSMCKWLDRKFGMDQGFGTYQVIGGPAAPKIKRLFHQVDSLKGEPFFAFLHLFDAHSDFERLPYDSRPKFQKLYAGWYDGPYDGTLPEFPDWGHSSRLLLRLNAEGLRLEGDERRYLADLYDAGVRTLDAQLERLFDGLEQRGLLENTIVAIVADHGEELYDHGRSLHSGQHDELMRIPFLLFVPGRPGAETDEFVGLIDLAPTLLDLAGLPVPQDMQGRSLAPLARGRAQDESANEVLFDNGKQLGLRSRELAAIPTPDGFGLFDMQADPKQLHNLSADPAWAARLPEIAQHLQARLETMAPLRKRLGAIPGTVALDEGDKRLLESIGYTGD